MDRTPGPITVPYVRNTSPGHAHGDFGETFGQHVEPRGGRYLSERFGDHAPEGWETGEVHFRNPLHMDWGPDEGYTHPGNWKHQLSERFDGKRGHELSQAVVEAGHDGIVTHDRYGTSEIVDLTRMHQRHHGIRLWAIPTQRIFGPTFGLDRRLFDGDQLKADVTHYILSTLDGFWRPMYGPGWLRWARVYFAGSEASEWTAQNHEGNNDFDVLVGVNYNRAREDVTQLALHDDAAITDRLNAEFRSGLMPHTDPTMIIIDGQTTGPWSNTFYVNQDSWDIRDIKPYAAYDVGAHEWAVKPPHLPDWSIEKFPEGHALVEMGNAYESLIKAIFDLPEPYRTQQGNALWTYLHTDRSRAFGPNGEGWYDPGNVMEKWFDQNGMWADLWAIHHRAEEDPTTLLAPQNWSNDPESGR